MQPATRARNVKVRPETLPPGRIPAPHLLVLIASHLVESAPPVWYSPHQ